MPINTTSINVSTNTNFNGTFVASPTTGRVIVTDAHPAGNYTVAVKAFGPGGAATKTFTLAVNGGAPCTPDSTDGFINAPDVSAGNSPISVAVGDFNGDGKQDLAIANLSTNPGIVSIRLGNGMGGFTGSAEVTVGAGPNAIAIGDFNGDGKQDFVVVSDTPSNSASIRFGDGRGGFSGSTNISVGSRPFSVAVGDFNGDGKQDFAVGNFESNTVSIRLGDGLGGFISAPDVSVTFQPNSVALGDFNGDGKPDLAVANYNIPGTVSIRIGDGLGGFGGSAEVSAGSIASSVAIGDFNEDGKQDLAIANYGSGSVSIRFGNGLGGFSGSTQVSVVSSPLAVVIGDFNRDGHQDLAIGGASIAIRLGDGLGGFSTFPNVPVGSQPFSIAIGDFNGDVRQDLAVANAVNGGPVSIRLGVCNPPVTVIVTTTNDSGPGSLRQALADAQDQTTIQFDPALNGQTINLTSGELLIGANITITGPGPGLLTVAGNLTNFRVFHILSGRTVAISGLTIRNGQANNGGGILNSGTLTITNCVVTSNRAAISGQETMPTAVTGAGIYNEGTLTLLNTTVSGNQTSLGASGGGGITNVAT